MPSSRTANFRLYLPNFNDRGWDSEINGNTRVIDAVLGKYAAIRNIVGVWENSTAYSVDDTVVDSTDGTLWAANSNLTSSTSPTTFSQERTNNPSYWRSVTVEARYRGEWETGTTYYVGDFVVSGDYYAVANTQHVAGATFAGDTTYWDVLVDLTNKLDTNGNGSAVTVVASGSTTARTLAARAGDQYFNVKDYGAVGDDSADDTAEIQAAIDACGAAGGGIVLFPNGVYRHTGLVIGDGSSGTASTYGNVTLVGVGDGSNGSADGVSHLKYVGTAGGTAVEFRGTIRGGGIRHLLIDGDLTAGTVLRLIGAYNGVYTDFTLRRCQANGWGLLLDPRNEANGNCGGNLFQRFNITVQASGSSGIGIAKDGPVLTNVGASRNVFIGGDVFFANTSATSYGIYLGYADNNTFMEMFTQPNGGETSGYGLYFNQQAAPNAQFPHENAFYNCPFMGGVGGTSGELGNIFFGYPTSDGQPVPSLDYLTVHTYDGRMYVNGSRIYRLRRVFSEELNGSTKTTTSGSYTTVTGLAPSITGVKSGSRLDITFTGSGAKNSGGAGSFILHVNGSDIGPTFNSINADGYAHPLAMAYNVAAATGSNTVDVRFKTNDANSISISHGVITVRELY